MTNGHLMGLRGWFARKSRERAARERAERRSRERAERSRERAERSKRCAGVRNDIRYSSGKIVEPPTCDDANHDGFVTSLRPPAVRTRERSRSQAAKPKKGRPAPGPNPPSDTKSVAELRPEVFAFLRDPGKVSEADAKWKYFSKNVLDDPERLYSLIINCAAEIGFDNLPDAHIRNDYLRYARERAAPGDRLEHKKMDQRTRAVVETRAEITARILSARNRRPILFSAITPGPSGFVYPRNGTEPERPWNRGKELNLTPMWFKVRRWRR